MVYLCPILFLITWLQKIIVSILIISRKGEYFLSWNYLGLQYVRRSIKQLTMGYILAAVPSLLDILCIPKAGQYTSIRLRSDPT